MKNNLWNGNYAIVSEGGKLIGRTDKSGLQSLTSEARERTFIIPQEKLSDVDKTIRNQKYQPAKNFQ
jgi:hypothetical protein